MSYCSCRSWSPIYSVLLKVRGFFFTIFFSKFQNLRFSHLFHSSDDRLNVPSSVHLMLTIGGAYQSWESLGWRAKCAKFIHLLRLKMSNVARKVDRIRNNGYVARLLSQHKRLGSTMCDTGTGTSHEKVGSGWLSF
jgi:hypothetical protein